jgi:hypothetical protein
VLAAVARAKFLFAHHPRAPARSLHVLALADGARDIQADRLHVEVALLPCVGDADSRAAAVPAVASPWSV